MSDTTYKYAEVTLYTPHNTYSKTVWPEDIEGEYDTLVSWANDVRGHYERFLSRTSGRVTLVFGNKQVILAAETAQNSEVEIKLTEDNDGLPF